MKLIWFCAVLMFVSASLCGCGAPSAVPDVAVAAPTATPRPTHIPQSAEVWTQVRAQIPADVPVYQPTWVPERFGPPDMAEVATSSNSESVYTVVYSAKDESLAFILNIGKGAMGNFPPPETKEQITVHDVSGQLLTSKETNTVGIFWQESGQSYQIKAYSRQMTRDELLRIADSFVAVTD